MSLFAGIYHHDSRLPVEAGLRKRLRDALNRRRKNVVTEFTWPGMFLVDVDVEALGTPSFIRTSDGGATVVAGELLVGAADGSYCESDLGAMSDSLRSQETALLRRARGTFCLCDLDPAVHRLTVAVDRLGVRPVYYYADANRVVFSTAFRVFEVLRQELQLGADLLAVTELVTLGYHLADRTPFTRVRCLRGGETVIWSQGQERHHAYWKWDEVPEDLRTADESASSLHETFVRAVRLRNRSDRRARAFLSGGLDSRCVVTALASSGVALDTYNMSPDGSLDRIIGSDYALRLGTSHHSLPTSAEVGGDVWPRLIGDFVRTEPPHAADRPRVFWSGDGGSVGVGRVYMSEAVVESLRAGNAEAAVDGFLHYNRTPHFGSILSGRVRSQANTSFHDALVEEFTRFQCSDPGKALLLFLLENDQRRHMALFFENIDVNRIEYEMPFFDGEVLAAATALNLDSTLRHRFYVKEWLPRFGPAASGVAWQAYPGHERCPLPAPQNGTYQWERNAATASRLKRKENMTRAFGAAVSRSFPTRILSRGRMMGIGISALLTGRDYVYVFRAVETFSRYFSSNRPPGPAAEDS